MSFCRIKVTTAPAGARSKGHAAKRGVEVDRSGNLRGVPVTPVSGQPSENGKASTPAQTVPKELGVLLVVGGIGGLLLPGPVGSPFLILGGVILWPAAFRRVENCFEKRFPRVHKQGMMQITRFVSDLERRYPWSQ
jgi:hypothetical protein